MNVTKLRFGAIIAGVALLTGCQPGAKTSQQLGFRGTGMDQIHLKSDKKVEAVPAPPYDPPAPGGKPAREAYQNVQVLGDVSEDQFNYTMASITQWIAPEKGCNYCHNPANMASDEVYTKVVARRMLQMTQTINSTWSSHVKQTGVTCYTCHRGQAVPTVAWTLPPAGKPGSIVGNLHGQNASLPDSGYAALPNAAVAKYLIGPDAPNIRVASNGTHPSPADKLTVMETENTYGLMMHTSQALGVNCTYCHNTATFRAWNISTPARATAWYGIRMVREINGNYISPLAKVFPSNRLGPMGDPLKVNCATCHRGQNKPLGGVSMLKDYPALRPSPAVVPAVAAPPPAPVGAGVTAAR